MSCLWCTAAAAALALTCLTSQPVTQDPKDARLLCCGSVQQSEAMHHVANRAEPRFIKGRRAVMEVRYISKAIVKLFQDSKASGNDLVIWANVAEVGLEHGHPQSLTAANTQRGRAGFTACLPHSASDFSLGCFALRCQNVPECCFISILAACGH
jgi:hypothetical protein